MPTLKDIQKQAREIWGLKIGTKSNQSDQEKVLFEIIDLAFQAGEKSKEDMVLKEIEGNKERFSCAACRGSKCNHTMSCQALSSLKEKIISNSK